MGQKESIQNEFFIYFNDLLPELRTEVLKYLSIQTLGRFIQINRSAEESVAKAVWTTKIKELDPSIWPQLNKRARKGDLKLLCAIINDASSSCDCGRAHSPSRLPFKWLELFLHLQSTYSVPPQNAFLCYLLTYAKHGALHPRLLNKNIGMKCGDVYLTHRRFITWFNSQSVNDPTMLNTRYIFRVILHQFARVTYCWSIRWGLDPLFINNMEAFLSVKLYDHQSNMIEFKPIMRKRKTKFSRPPNNSEPFHIDTQKTSFYSIKQILKNKFKVELDGVELAPYDLYYFFDYLDIDDRQQCQNCHRIAAVPQVIKNWLLNKQWTNRYID